MVTTTPSPQSPALKRVQRGNLCAGCGGCALVAPDKICMEMVPPGYLRPLQSAPLDPEEETTIKQICPGLVQSVDVGSRTDDILWGPYESMSTGHATNPKLRFVASSGGSLSAILVHLLESGAVDAVIQTSAAPDIPVANVTVLSETAADIQIAAGSRYAPSAPLAKLEPYLKSNKRFAFVGKPCDVAALRALATIDTRVDARIRFMLSFFCAGVPSQAGAEAVLAQLGTTLNEIAAFRYRGHGWPGRATATLKDGSERSMTYHESWGGVLSAHAQLRCKICADGTGKAADIVCADAWESDDKGYPVFEERAGISLIVARTKKGEKIIKAAAKDSIKTTPFDVSRLGQIQPGQYVRRTVLLGRLMGLFLLGRPIPKYEGLNIFGAAREGRKMLLLKNLAGILKRGLQGRLH